MKHRHYWIVGIIAILGLLIISGCAKQQAMPSPTEENITNQCISDLNVFEDKFGISAGNITVLSSECSTCSPWYTPQVATFKAIIKIDDYAYNLFFSDTCPRHDNSILNYRIITNEPTEVYNKTKENICTYLSNQLNDLYFNCWITSEDFPTIKDFTSCVNNYSKYIEHNIIDIDKDWEYCSTEGWKYCEEWNSCEPTGSTETSICTPEYCKMSCLLEYSEKKIRKKFIELCKNEEMLGQNYIFSFESPKDVKNIFSNNFLK